MFLALELLYQKLERYNDDNGDSDVGDDIDDDNGDKNNNNNNIYNINNNNNMMMMIVKMTTTMMITMSRPLPKGFWPSFLFYFRSHCSKSY